jgi:hypothetical protein
MRSAWCCGPGGYLSIYLRCGVFVQLHLALFPAGGPFLPSLYVNIFLFIYALFPAGGPFLPSLSVTLFIYASLCRSGAYVATRAAGRAPMRGLAQPSAEVV